MLENLKRIAIFNKVVECGSFTRAGLELGMAKSKVSEQVTALEANLKVRLLNRSTRSISLTTEGATFYESSQGLMNQAEDAVNSLAPMVNEISGLIRIGTSVDVGMYLLIPQLKRFNKKYPKVIFDVQLEDELKDPIQHNLDLVIRIGELKSSSLVGRVLAPFKLGIYASKTYLKNHKAIKTLDDLKYHDWIAVTRMSLPNNRVSLIESSGFSRCVRVRPRHQTNSPMAAMSMIQQNMGIGPVANFLVKQTNDDSLVQLFPQFSHQGPSMNILYPSRKNIPPRTHLLIQFLIQEMHHGAE
ncbi:HTH-type transcriptional regulator DmlR [Vibrio aerogenes CECT 7868]|uniref:HTH-type transcriptional regulator DmlR n=1 Tax=Vibrio aerogenes CECT 7868 TaxID=1216006 RepID=A0A1M5ZYY1_9VIBR|nr:LysR family transcriptional regulator [Vibrio aerogenes]SHI29356.1 HTH-type transcriptional regulator DmlR [Vibrio aerogenes CECT 7868]